MQFSIHQFSSGINNPSRNKKGDWVSGGFGKEIERESSTVPEEIKKAVQPTSKGGCRGFAIQEAYPPKTGEIAVIARDLGNYCVLAVANKQGDDTGTRSFAAYRYFWLDKRQFQNLPNKEDFDGIATLLLYWQQKGKPQFDIGELQTNPNSYTKSWDILQEYRLFEHSQKHSTRIKLLLDNIRQSNQPLLYENINHEKLSPEELHCLAIKYSSLNQVFVNWAWNVRRLENLKGLNVIDCADADAYKWFSHQFPSNQFPSSDPTPMPTPTPSGQGGSIVPASTPRGTEISSSNIRDCLLKFRGAFTPKDILDLMNYSSSYIQQNNIEKFQDKNYIDSFVREGSDLSDQHIKYATLLSALAPNQTQNILPKLMGLNQRQKNVAINFLVDLKKMARDNNSCHSHPSFLNFSEALSSIQDQLFKSLEPKRSRLDMSNLPKTIRSFLPLIFFLLLFSGMVKLMYWQWPIISARSPGNTVSPVASGTTISTPTPTTGLLADLLDKYERQYQGLKTLDKNKPEIDKNNTLQEIETGLEHYRQKVLKQLEDNKALFEQKLKGESTIVQEARKEAIYTDIKALTTLALQQFTLPLLKPNSINTIEVTMLQKALKRGKYYTPGQEDSDPPGTFGEATKTAVQSAQEKGRLLENGRDGVVGKQTWAVLIDRLRDEQVEMVYQTLKEHLNKGNTDYNIVTEIKQCRDKNKDVNALHFVSCLETIPKQQQTYSTTNQTPNPTSSEGGKKNE